MLIRGCLRLFQHQQRAVASFGFLQDKMELRRKKQAEDEFKNEIEALANKPTFTLLDYKQRVNDQLSKVRKGIKSKLSKANEEVAEGLEGKRKILSAFFDEELLGEKPLNGDAKGEIALVAQVEAVNVNQLLRDFEKQAKMHALLRQMKENGEPLPKSMEELQYAYMHSNIEHRDRRAQRKQRFQRRSRRQQLRYMKWGKL